MDVLYVIGTGSKWYNYELKYSLRSLEKYGKNVGQIYIVGFKPHFINENVIHIPCDDTKNKKHKCILNKVITAIESGKLPEHFLISSDDHIYVKETDFDKLPVYWYRDFINGSHEKEYMESLLETDQFLKEHNISTYSTNPHCNTHFDIKIYNKYKELFDKGMELPNGVEMNCLMGNLLIKEGLENQHYKDTCIARFKDRKDLLNQIGDAECISLRDSSIPCGMDKYLKELFPKPSKWEKTLKL